MSEIKVSAGSVPSKGRGGESLPGPSMASGGLWTVFAFLGL